jgi:uncharacterized protein YbjT (DUF2867 family)
MKIAVTGATGRQGGAVASHLLRAGAGVRALVRNPRSPAALALAERGADLVEADFTKPSSLAPALRGVDGPFAVQPLIKGNRETEVAYGRALADAARAAGAGYFVYSSVLGADDAPDVSHFAAKHDIELHVRSIGLPHTILRPAGFMENLLIPIVKKGIAKGKLTAPAGIDTPQPVIAVDDIGAFAAIVFHAPDRYLGKTVALAGDTVSTRQQAEVLTRVLGRTVKPAQLPGLIVRLVMGGDLYRMFRWVDRRAAAMPFDIAALRADHPGLMSFEPWCRREFGGERQ